MGVTLQMRQGKRKETGLKSHKLTADLKDMKASSRFSPYQQCPSKQGVSKQTGWQTEAQLSGKPLNSRPTLLSSTLMYFHQIQGHGSEFAIVQRRLN